MLGGPWQSDDDSVYHESLLRGRGVEKKEKELRLIHITKCAGTTLENVSKRTWGKHDQDYMAAVSSIYTRDGASWHVPLQFAKQHVLRDLLKKFDYFVVVRNPYDRAVSEFFCPWGGAGNKRQTTVSGFNEWIRTRLDSIKAMLADKSGDTVLQGHWTPQYMYVADSTGKLIVHKDNVVFLEDLKNQYSRLVERYHLPSEFNLNNAQSLNVGSEKTFAPSDLDSRNIALIGEIYGKDFEFFGYSTEVPSAPAPPKPKEQDASSSSSSQPAKRSISGASGGDWAGAVKEKERGQGEDRNKKRKLEAKPNASFQELLSLMKKT